jgi:membrane-bound serine protease (ClpP class)
MPSGSGELVLAYGAAVDPGVIDALARILAEPWVAPVLLTVGILGILVEIKAFAHGLAGALGVLALALFFGSHFLVGSAGGLELALLAAGVVLVVIEGVALPGMGAFGILGGLAILASIFLSLVGHPATPEAFSTAAGVLGVTLVAVMVSAWALARTIPGSSHLRRSGVMLSEATTREAGYIAAPLRAELVGSTGRALTDLRPSGTAEFAGEHLDVVADGKYIPAGSTITVVRSDGYRHVVRAEE